VILTGTPPVFLKAGDTVTIEIERIGSLTNPVVEERVGRK
jgi:2-keto-4-pentenoate hydratase/2-oxohepta-3-ene-1,7-dioic acid hydratase in catechol pathway